MNKMYESNISDKKWLTLGLVSDVGWIAYFAGLALYMTSGADGLGTVIISVLFLLNCLCGLAVLVGIVALILQRVRKLSRRLKRSQLVIGFGLVVYGALGGFWVSGAAVVIDILSRYETGLCFAAQCVMAAGAFICFAFGLPIMRSFRPETDD